LPEREANQGVIAMTAFISQRDRPHVVVIETPGEWLEDELSTDERACSVCGRSQPELQQAGHSLRFLCPDDVCTDCLIDDAAA
jgi:hypothetical protein